MSAGRSTRSRGNSERAGDDEQNTASPLSALGLKSRFGEDEDKERDSNGAGGIELNRRGLPARKRKKNSLIFGDDDLVSIPVRSPRKKRDGSAANSRSASASPVKAATPRAKRAMREAAPATTAAASATITKQEDERAAKDVEEAMEILHGIDVDKRTEDDEEGEDEEDADTLAETGKRSKPPRRSAAIAANSAFDGSKSAPSTPAAAEKKDAERASSPPLPPRRVTRASTARTPSASSSAAGTPKASPKKRVVTTGKRAVKAKAIAGKTLDDLELTSPEKKSAQQLGVALRNLLKLPKAHKWVCYEFFYSNIDRALFEGETDFMVCIRESFPMLKTRRLTRVEWCKIRRLMGKPRRCSQAFFTEERMELARKRHKIRLLQQRKQRTEDAASFKDLPDDIPLQLTIGARVTARLRKPQDGLFTGTVDACDTSNSTYRITFDRAGLGTHSIPDFEVLSTTDPDTVPLTTFTSRPKPRPVAVKEEKLIGAGAGQGALASGLVMPAAQYGGMSPVKYGLYSPGLSNDPLLSGSTPRGKVMRMDGQVGGYPVRFLEQIVRLSKCLKLKRERVSTLKELNCLGERKKSFGEYISEDFQRRYASAVVELSQLNRDLNEHLENIAEFTQQFSNEAGPTISLPNIIREGCYEDAYNMVNKNNAAVAAADAAQPPPAASISPTDVTDKKGDKAPKSELVENPKTLALISSLTALMLHIKQLADGERNAFELQALQDSLAEVKSGLRPENAPKFQNAVEVHMQHIQSGLSQMGNLHAFMLPQKAGPPSGANATHHQQQLQAASIKLEQKF